jgi:hypothetical protein
MESPELIILAVCDVLVVKALEKLGNYVVRADRARFRQLADSGLPLHQAHTLWPTNDALVDKALRGAWDVVPYVLDTYDPKSVIRHHQVVEVLDTYVHDLSITGSQHERPELAYRLRQYLDIQLAPVFFEARRP